MAFTENDLMEELKQYLRITWPDQNSEVLGIVKRGKAYLNEIGGGELDYEQDETVRQLLFDYGRYVYNHSFELFEINFQNELVKLSIREGVKSIEAENTETST
ncbi:phage gp6-like head-tail connector protein [Halobacillus salinus]|uniref:Phage gp6-like head-tail connector protein n=1 Tax=Halobacillus salinus TaxID=192814 RepID=A0A4Z0H451_9BACI|nr:phage gp6-like head-tail connector protein [Halobacillus salinus]TGB04694.1 phage gp6-like head-tail connector protein [Halobacillus salinus]